jgi:ribosomal protein S18 acetylase RimI-like enzyme
VAARSAVDLKRLHIGLLSRDDAAATLGFSCGDGDLDDFLQTDAARLHSENIVRTYLAQYEGELVGYVSLLVDAVVLETRERKKMALGAHDHPIVPALKVARLGVSESFREKTRGVGEALMRFAFLRALDLADHVGCRLLTVDAYPASVGFYERLGFVRNRAKEYAAKAHPSMRLDVFGPVWPGWVDSP